MFASYIIVGFDIQINYQRIQYHHIFACIMLLYYNYYDVDFV